MSDTLTLPPARRYAVIAASFIVMLMLGGVYGWSLFVPELTGRYGMSNAQAQLVFGLVIAVFPVSMIFVGCLEAWLSVGALARISSVLFLSGYLLASFSGGEFWLVLVGIGLVAGVGTGLGYLIALTTPILWFPKKKGLVTGFAAAGFGLAAIFLAQFVSLMDGLGLSALEMFRWIALSYGVIIFICSFFIQAPEKRAQPELYPLRKLLKQRAFLRLFFGIFLGSFAGFLVIGNLKPIGSAGGASAATLIHGISLFAFANFLGRLSWGALSDHFPARFCIAAALGLQGLFIVLIGNLQFGALDWGDPAYLLLSFAVGFSFGSNFVLFAKETAHLFTVERLNQIYPMVFLGSAVAGLLGPTTGGFLYDTLENYQSAAWVAGVVSTLGALLFLLQRNAGTNAASSYTTSKE